MNRLSQRLPQSRQGWVTASFLAGALVLGGGGSPSPAAEIVVQLAFVAAAFAWLWWARDQDAPAMAGTGPLLWLAALIVALPLLQLIPLPPSIWHALPGRETMVAALGVVEDAKGWHALSVAPYATLAALLAMIPVAGAMLAAGVLARYDRRFILLVVGVVALAGAALGVMQMAGGDGAFRLYRISHDQWLTAFHASRNSAADALLIGMLALTGWFAGAARRRPLLASDFGLLTLAQLFLLAALLMTGSRTGIALAVPVLVIEFAMLRSQGIAPAVTKGVAAIAGLFALLVVAGTALSGNARIAGVLARFDTASDTRPGLWRDSWTALEQFWPAGSGLGTFSRAFLPVERMAVLDDLFPNRAHNDFIEFVIEGGVVAPLAMAVFAVLIAILARRAWNNARSERPVVLFSLGTLVVIGLHSFVDYPLRNMALAVTAGVAIGLLGATGRESREMDEG